MVRQTIRVAVLADKGIESAEAEWAYVFDWLRGRLPQLDFVLVALDHPGLRQAVHERSVDFVITNAGNYSELEHSDGLTRLVTLDSPLALSPTQAVGSAVIVRADAPLTELTDLQGKHVLAASPDAFCCFQIAARELKLAGVDPESDLGRLEFVGFPIQAIARAVRDGKADAGIVKTCLIEQMVERGEIAPGALRVLSPRQITGFPCQTSSRLYPDWPFAALADTAPRLAKAVTIALLEMPRSPSGSQWTIPAQYDSVDELFRDLGIGRYARLQQETLAALIQRHRVGIGVVAVLLFALIIHAVRVDYLVTRRTRELSEMHAEKERLAAAMRERQSELEHAGRMAILGGMASAIAHELKQPLAAIANYARGIDRRIATGRLEAEPLQNVCREIARQSSRAAQTIEKIREFAHKGGGSIQPVALEPLVKEAVDLFGIACPEAKVVWKGDSVRAGARVRADAIQIQQVVLNLLQNAIEAQTTHGNPGAPIEVSLTAEQHGYRVAVRDRGGGLDTQQRARLFEPFFTTKPAGLGLGLSLCKGIVESHGGTLELHDADVGVCASFWLPEEEHG
ncbi:sensor histidine kinase [Sulfuricystis multivorans]|uniref:sensor histidine kinase n=1 Tax=Sulfuricystis multivorans TaxID=2211108 RepID=UPI00155910D5|nr:PhnD/SsuA/transferrin family substrate-binding protein [Sulfuricystis multivorans]